MAKSANEVMQGIIFAAVIDGVMALKDASKGLPNTLLRDIQALHPNTTFDDLPKELQAAIAASVREAFTRLMREGYAVGPSGGQAPRPTPPSDRPRTGDRPPPRGPRPARPREPARDPRGQRPKPRGPRT